MACAPAEYQQRYTVREQEVYEQLVQLIKRSALFKDGIAMSFRIFQVGLDGLSVTHVCKE